MFPSNDNGELTKIFMANHSVNPNEYRYQKIVLGALGASMLSIGGLMYVAAPAANLLISAILIRVGVLLCVIWLAWDQVLQVSKHFSVLILATVMGLLILIAARPNLAKIVVVCAAVLGGASLLSKFFRASDPR